MITVIIPILNSMPYLPEALASLEAQTFRDFEVCMWDNGSTDGSVEEARRWIPDRLPGRVVTNRPLPLHECLAAMVEEARTEFVARMDGDDVSLPRRFEWQVQALNQNPRLGIIGGQIIYMDEAGRQLKYQELLPCMHEDIITQMLCRSALTHAASMFRRDSILAAGNYSEPKPVEDLDLYLRMASLSKFLNLDVPLYKYRIHSSSVCQTSKKNHITMIEKVINMNSEKIYGLKSKSSYRLRCKNSPCALIDLLVSCKHRSNGNPKRFCKIVFSPWFVANGRYFAGKRDYISKIAFRLIEKMVGKLPAPAWIK